MMQIVIWEMGLQKKPLKKLNMEKIKIANMMFKKSNRELLYKRMCIFLQTFTNLTKITSKERLK